MTTPALLDNPSRYLFFTGKGGVGKTSLSCAVALALADLGKQVLLVSTDPASNLDEMLGARLSDQPSAVPKAPNLFAMNIDPDKAADDYRARVIDQLDPEADEEERATVREQLSGACTIEIAAFDEFVGLLAGDADAFDHVIFDTAPTGHTLRLLSLPRAWTGFLQGNDRGASCLGPHSGLKMQEDRFRAALQVLADPVRTSIVLVTRADRGAVREAARTSDELRALGLGNQRLVVNGVFHASGSGDVVAEGLARDHAAVIAALPPNLATLPRDEVPLRSFDMVGLPALRALFSDEPPAAETALPAGIDGPALETMVDELAKAGRGLIMVMGKGGVGKTTVAAAVAVGLVKRGHKVHLTTTDPAAHVSLVVDGSLDGLVVDRIDPAIETERYVAKVLATKGRDMDAADRALLREDLASPCTEEVAVFHAFSRIVAEARAAFVVMDTAPTGHTLLLLDATGAYHRQMTQDMGTTPGRIITPLMRLQDPDYTRVILVALPETTPVSEAASLQEDLRRAKIQPWAWVVNRSLAKTGTADPLLRLRISGEASQLARIRGGLAQRLYLLPFQAEPPVGIPRLLTLT
ncbi:arsenical pump-driving ATPase [Tabrizicola sp. J26]|uniref:arsenical pump-driving ATPase n=1 Tax=Alitabrizicola rongguiensis TaxID=2909234 RepID=UPI001F384F9B|nr:arsenical pump-driving ATPase [Tabrizicola rongguiensis]MCF1709745.1 arsenical pump-driving ATPase [Tabrizicola rongguiensis]